MQLHVRDAARLLSVSEKTIYRWVRDGKLPALRVSDQYRFNRADLLEWATANRVPVSPEIFQEPESAGGAALPSLEEALRAGRIFYRVGGADKTQVLRNVVDLMPLPDEVDRQFLFEVMLARESLSSTGIGDGIAIPHVRNPIVMHIPRPMATLCFLEKAVDFGAIDGQPVHTLFAIVSPTVRAHLHLLSRLAFALKSPAFLAALGSQASQDAIVEACRQAEAPRSYAPVRAGRG